MQATARARESTHTVVPLVQVLRQLAELVDSLSDEQYTAAPVGVFTGCIGGHVRHCLDHVVLFLDGLECGCADYDHRERGTDVETRRDAALELMKSLEQRLRGLSESMLRKPITVQTIIDRDGEKLTCPSSGIRELVFVQSHTIHHNAIIGAMAKTLHAEVPRDFGYAPSTLAFLDESPAHPSRGR